MPTDNQKRMDRIRRLVGVKTDVELAEYFKTNQPQISRWRSAGFHSSTANLVDTLLSIISGLRREKAALKKEIKALRADLEQKVV